MTAQDTETVQPSPVRGDLIRHLRETYDHGDEHRKPGYTRQKFASKADVSPSTLQRVEASDPSTTVPVLARVARALDVPLSRIYDSALAEELAGARAADIDLASTQWEQLDARLAAIEKAQGEILRELRKRR